MRKLFVCLLAWLTLCFMIQPASAGQVVLVNGDRLTGEIIRLDEKGLTIKSEHAGEVTIQWKSVESFTSETALNILLKDGQKLVGPVGIEAGRMQVATERVGRVGLNKEAIDIMRSPAEETAYQAELERLRNPGLLDLWKGFVDVGLSSTQGNAETSTFNLGMNAVRSSSRDKVSVYFTSLRAASTTRGLSLTTANATRGGLKYNLNINSRTSAFGFTDLEYDEFQSLDLRFVAGGGLAYKVLNTDITTLDLSFGGAGNKEFFSTGLRRSSGEVLVGQELTHQLFGGLTQLQQSLFFFPNLSETGEYRMNFDVAAITRLSRWLSWQITASDRFLSNPVTGRKKNDLLLTTGLRITFAR